MPTLQETHTSYLRLHDGRRLAYAEFGDPVGRPLLFCHGWGDSRLTRHPDDALAASLGVRLITVDRPGFGESDFQPHRRLLDWPADVAELADQLGLRRFAVLGHSGGGPFALACAARLADRLTMTGVACGFAPMDRPAATMGMQPRMRRFVPLMRRAPWLARPMLASLPRQYRRDPDKAFEQQFGHGLPESDRAMLARPEIRSNLLAGAVEALRPGAKGLSQEVSLFLGKPWGFDPSAIAGPVRLWYGDADTLVPPQMGRYLEASIPGARLTVFPGEGHMLHLAHWGELLQELCEAE